MPGVLPMPLPDPVTLPPRRVGIEVRGLIQGVGFRPFVYNSARKRGLSGWVQNEAAVVRIEVQGDGAAVAEFLAVLRDSPPPQARIDTVKTTELPIDPEARGEFEIRLSPTSGPTRPTIPADLATCLDCLVEIRTLGERRHAYAFTNCTNCGPRWSIIEHLPYDRPRTTMAWFRMCPACREEYDNPADRRFHAQPIACPHCGPLLQFGDFCGGEQASGEMALARAASTVLAGQILALKGLGGYQLLVDATNGEAVAELRARKRRYEKPFALMLSTLDEIRRRCLVSDAEARVLQSPQAPIMLLRRRCDAKATADVVSEVAPANPYLGVMLPYTPLHHLLLAAVDRPVVCTSGNLSEEPMAIALEDAVERLEGIADVLLTHDRRIVRPVDDSVVRVTADGPQVLRRARGYAPMPIELGLDGPPILAVGGHLKNTVALRLGSQIVLSSHVGDLDNLLSVEVFQRAISDLVDFFAVTPQAVACDLHPDYTSTRHAEALAAGWKVPLVRVQHHHAHVAACMAEHRLEGEVLGFSWDGTGYGADGTVWGGEVLQCQEADYRRVAHLRTFMLPGGDRASREPRRSALGLLFEILGDEAITHAGAWFKDNEAAVLLAMLRRGTQSPRTSSMGRLFDAVAALCGLPTVIRFEGHAAMSLEFAADEEATESYPIELSGGEPAVADWEPMVHAVLADRAAGVPIGRISARFHNALADLAVTVAKRWGGRNVVLTGGCFQNALLARRLQERLQRSGFVVYTHHQVPPGDGGIALGQVAVAARVLAERK